MRQVVDAGRWGLTQIRRPALSLALVTWGVLSALLYWTTPFAPIERFDLGQASWELDKQRCELGLPIPGRNIVAVSADGGVFVTADKSNWPAITGWRGNRIQGPVRVWDLRAGKRIIEFATAEDTLDDIRLSPDGTWISMRRNAAREIHLTAGGRKITFDARHEGLCHSNDGQSVAYREESTLQLYEPRTDLCQTILECSWQEQDALRRSIVHGVLHAFSADDRWLAIGTYSEKEKHCVVLLDVLDGGIVAKVHLPSSFADVRISRDKKTLAITTTPTWRLSLVVMDIANDEALLELQDAKFLGWDFSQTKVIVFCNRWRWTGTNDGPSRLESWNLQTGQREAIWEVPETPKIPFPPGTGWAGKPWEFAPRLRPSGWPVLSPDGTHVLWTDYGHEKNESPAWQKKLGAWLGRAPPVDYFLEVRMLDTETFAEKARWRVDADFGAVSWDGEPFLQWHPASDRLFVANGGRVEIWRVPPRSLSQSMGIALAVTWVMGIIWYGFRRWRTRARETISKPSPPNSGS